MITKDDVKKIAHLAKLNLSEAEIEKFLPQLQQILENAKMLDEVDTTGVEPIAQITGLQTVLFEDSVKNCEYSEKLLAESPMELTGKMIKVKNIF